MAVETLDAEQVRITQTERRDNCDILQVLDRYISIRHLLTTDLPFLELHVYRKQCLFNIYLTYDVLY